MFWTVLALLVFLCVGHVAWICWTARNWQRRPLFVSMLLCLYVGSYALLSFNGRYILANHGGADWTRTWCPAFVLIEYRIIRPHIRPTPLAAIYLPILLLDRLLVHPAIEPWDGYFDAQGHAAAVRPLELRSAESARSNGVENGTRTAGLAASAHGIRTPMPTRRASYAGD